MADAPCHFLGTSKHTNYRAPTACRLDVAYDLYALRLRSAHAEKPVRTSRTFAERLAIQALAEDSPHPSRLS